MVLFKNRVAIYDTNEIQLNIHELSFIAIQSRVKYFFAQGI